MTEIDSFLSLHGWSNADRLPLAGDASSRQYIRLYSRAKHAILMVDPQDDTARFASIAEHLNVSGFSAPKIIAKASKLMLIEDFGDAQFAKVISDSPKSELPLYRAATDVLCQLECSPAPSGLNIVTPDILGDMIDPALTYYIPTLGGEHSDRLGDLKLRVTEVLDAVLPTEKIIVLRDFHAENMIWLPEREGVKRVGLLDFQDALLGPPIYDLVSMLQDARRDVTKQCHDETIKHYVAESGRSEPEILPVFHILGIQRNLRILGIFARLAVERAKPSYLDLIPRVWGHIQTSLQEPVGQSLKPIVDEFFPEPTSTRLNKVKSQCLTQ